MSTSRNGLVQLHNASQTSAFHHWEYKTSSTPSSLSHLINPLVISPTLVFGFVNSNIQRRPRQQPLPHLHRLPASSSCWSRPGLGFSEPQSTRTPLLSKAANGNVSKHGFSPSLRLLLAFRPTQVQQLTENMEYIQVQQVLERAASAACTMLQSGWCT